MDIAIAVVVRSRDSMLFLSLRVLNIAFMFSQGSPVYQLVPVSRQIPSWTKPVDPVERVPVGVASIQPGTPYYHSYFHATSEVQLTA